MSSSTARIVTGRRDPGFPTYSDSKGGDASCVV
ncbi:hypothetical protein M2271_004050 [Streptomyces sp. LBL]|nr:hypothetical protein [Streptomyces sp. LBL]